MGAGGRTLPGGLFDRIFGGSERFGGGERAAQPGGQAGQERAAPSGSDLVVRLERLEAQIRQLTGVIEQLQFRNQQLEQQVRRMQEDTEHRFQELGAQGRAAPGRCRVRSAPAPPLRAARSAGTAAPGTARRCVRSRAASERARRAADARLGARRRSRRRRQPDARLAPGGAPPARRSISPRSRRRRGRRGQSRRCRARRARYAREPKDEYDLAYGYVLRKDYALAEDAFRNFSEQISERPDGGRRHLLARRKPVPAPALPRRGRSLPQRLDQVRGATPEAPDALLRLGQSLAALGEKEAACASLGEVLRKFPRASASVKQSVEREQKRVRC